MALGWIKNRARKWLGVDALASLQEGGWGWLFGGATKSSAGVNVTPERAMQLATVFACVRVLSESLACLPLLLYRRIGAGRIIADNQPLAEILHSKPNNWQTAQEFFEFVVTCVCLRGNFFAKRLPGLRGSVDQLIPLHPDLLMKVEMLENYTLRYTFRGEKGRQEVYLQDELLHIRGLSLDGILGVSVIEYARNTIGLSIATEEHGATLFKNGARPGVVFERTAPMQDTAADKFRESWERMHSGSENAHRTAILPLGLKPAQLGLNNDDAQFLDTRKYQRSEICGVFRVPPHKIGDLDRATFTNIEEQNISFVQEGLLPWARRIEQACNRDLVSEPLVYFCEFLFEGLLRGKSVDRAAFYTALWNMGVLNANEIRQMENLNPIGPDGDKRFVQLNMTTLEKAGEEPVTSPPETGPQPEPPADGNMSAAIGPACDVFNEAAAKLLRWEVDAVNRLAGKGGNFLAAVDEFYTEHEQRTRDALNKPTAILSLIGLEGDFAFQPLGGLAVRQHAVIEAAGTATAATLKSVIEQLTAGWKAPTVEPPRRKDHADAA